MSSTSGMLCLLWYKNPHCAYCGIKTLLPKHFPNYKEIKNIYYNLATIDHKYSRWYPQSYRHKQQQWVLSCYLCNQKKARLEHLAIPKAYMLKISQGKRLSDKEKESLVPILDKILIDKYYSKLYNSVIIDQAQKA